ncbi:succinate dehydrogenase assembly factor 2 [Oceaniglobus trochenteri]|uniref:succinate dehydrogenase assembly factor 2 n=1 Tax=Oceaniglobus trochenteri TaxID=2763260 RepID=UPI001CFF63FF|nr:succinate dehydrogenase assembly factor 2 [Oceaniglobus trochenteri]
MTPETPEHRLKRLAMRSWRRGIKEMDLILGAYADAGLERLSPEWLDLYDRLLAENDHDLYQWVTGQAPSPAHFAPLIDDISRHGNCR